jgi:hypothetical protein
MSKPSRTFDRAIRIEQIVLRDHLADLDCVGLALDELRQDPDRSNAVIAKAVAMRKRQRPQAHDFLVDQGAYVHSHIDADRDHDKFDLYEGDSHDLIFQRGRWVDTELIDWDQVRAFESFSFHNGRAGS